MSENAENLLRDALQKRGISTHLGLSDDFSAALAEAYRAGQIAQAEEDAEILREQLTEAERPDQRMTLAIAIRAIERGRNLTATEKMKNLMDAMAEFDREEASRLRAEGDLK